MREGSLREDALANLKAHKIDIDDFAMKLLQLDNPKEEVGNYTYKMEGLSHSFTMKAKLTRANDSTYVEIASFHH